MTEAVDIVERLREKFVIVPGRANAPSFEAQILAERAEAADTIEAMRNALKQIAALGGNLPDERLVTATGPRDAVARGEMYTAAREIAHAALSQMEEKT